MVLGVGISTGLQLADPVFHAILALFAACSGIHGQGGQIVATHMTVQSCPVRIQLALRGEAGLLQERGQQAVVVVLQQYLDVQVARMSQRTVCQRDITKWELVGIEPILCLTAYSTQQQHGCEGDPSNTGLHSLHIVFRLLSIFGTKLQINYEL